jgi:DNA-directed RNA polymerase subunit beta'
MGDFANEVVRLDTPCLRGPFFCPVPADADWYVHFFLATPEELRRDSSGLVRAAEYLDSSRCRPHPEGLFSEKIFGPVQDFTCACDLFHGAQGAGKTCPVCGVAVDRREVRSKRFGHIDLAVPVLHPFLFQAAADLLGLSRSELKDIVKGRSRVEVPQSPDQPGQVLTGAPAVKHLLQSLDLVRCQVTLGEQVRSEDHADISRPLKPLRELYRRKHLIDRLLSSGKKPDCMVFEVLPVLPAGMRVRGRRARVINRLYRQVIRCNHRLAALKERSTSQTELDREAWRLQCRVRALFIQLSRGRLRPRKPRLRPGVRAAVVPNPSLRLEQCGLPDHVAWDLLGPQTLGRLQEHGFTAAEAAERVRIRDEDAWDALKEVVGEISVLLSWDPVGDLQDFQAFRPVLVPGRAVHVHPAVVSLTGGLFDGERVTVRLLHSKAVQTEAEARLQPARQLRDPANGSIRLRPTADAVLGCAYLTADPLAPFLAPDGALDERIKEYRKNLPPNLKGEGTVFANPAEVFLAFSLKKLGVHARIHLRLPLKKRVISTRALTGFLFINNEEVKGPRTVTEEVVRKPLRPISTTVGRVLFNALLDARMPFYDLAQGSETIVRVLDDCSRLLGDSEAVALVRRINTTGFRELTNAGLSFSMDDLRTPPAKTKILEEAGAEVDKCERQFVRGIVTAYEQYTKSLNIWSAARDKITKQMMAELGEQTRDGAPELNPIFLTIRSGACGSDDALLRMAGMHGLAAKPSGDTLAMPIKSNLREGLKALEYFASLLSFRRDLANTTRWKAEARQLTKDLAEIGERTVISGEDCGSARGISFRLVRDPKPSPHRAIRGRVSRYTVRDPSGTAIVRENEAISGEAAEAIVNLGIDNFMVRSPLTCLAPRGICRRCYGIDPTTGGLIEQGVPIGTRTAFAVKTNGPPRQFRWSPLVSRSVVHNEAWARKRGRVRFKNVSLATNESGETVVIGQDGRLEVCDWKDRTLETFQLNRGMVLRVTDGQDVQPRATLVQWDPNRVHVLATRAGTVRYDDIAIGQTARETEDAQGLRAPTIRDDYDARFAPRIAVLDEEGRLWETHYLPGDSWVYVTPGQRVNPGTKLAAFWRPDYYVDPYRDVSGYPDQCKSLRKLLAFAVPRSRGEIDPRDLLRNGGIEFAERFLFVVLRRYFQSMAIDIDSRHLETVLSPMLRWVRVVSKGDSQLVPSVIIGKFRFERIVESLQDCVKILNPGDSEFLPGQIVKKEEFEKAQEGIGIAKKQPPTCQQPILPTCQVEFLGIEQLRRLVGSEWRHLRGNALRTWLAEASLVGHTDIMPCWSAPERS